MRSHPDYTDESPDVSVTWFGLAMIDASVIHPKWAQRQVIIAAKRIQGH